MREKKQCPDCNAEIPSANWICDACYWRRTLRAPMEFDEAKKRVRIEGWVVELSEGRWFMVTAIKTVVYGDGGQNHLYGTGRFIAEEKALELRAKWEQAEMERVNEREKRTSRSSAYWS